MARTRTIEQTVEGVDRHYATFDLQGAALRIGYTEILEGGQRGLQAEDILHVELPEGAEPPNFQAPPQVAAAFDLVQQFVAWWLRRKYDDTAPETFRTDPRSVEEAKKAARRGGKHERDGGDDPRGDDPDGPDSQPDQGPPGPAQSEAGLSGPASGGDEADGGGAMGDSGGAGTASEPSGDSPRPRRRSKR